jgi:ATP phosphoribosyltransferase
MLLFPPANQQTRLSSLDPAAGVVDNHARRGKDLPAFDRSVSKGYTLSTMTPDSLIRLALPKGHLEKGVFQLLADAGIEVKATSRSYRPTITLPGFDTKILRPQNMVEMLHLGSRDLGFAGADWVAEVEADLVELLDLELDPVRIVAAAPTEILENGKLPKRPITVVSEYKRLTERWMKERGYEGRVIFSYGATEVFPPEDADVIVDNTATGATLRANGLDIIDTVMRSTTRFYARPAAVKDPEKKEKIDHFVMLLQSVLEARKRVMVEVNVSVENLEALVDVLPCMREPTISPLHGNSGYAVKAAVPRKELPLVIPKLKACGGTDIVVSPIAQIVS